MLRIPGFYDKMDQGSQTAQMHTKCNVHAKHGFKDGWTGALTTRGRQEPMSETNYKAAKASLNKIIGKLAAVVQVSQSSMNRTPQSVIISHFQLPATGRDRLRSRNDIGFPRLQFNRCPPSRFVPDAPDVRLEQGQELQLGGLLEDAEVAAHKGRLQVQPRDFGHVERLGHTGHRPRRGVFSVYAVMSRT